MLVKKSLKLGMALAPSFTQVLQLYYTNNEGRSGPRMYRYLYHFLWLNILQSFVEHFYYLCSIIDKHKMTFRRQFLVLIMDKVYVRLFKPARCTNENKTQE
jgi:hypothetical protein